MRTQTREVTSGDKKGSYTLNVPENVAEFVKVLATSDETREVTVNVSGLMRLAEYAMKAWLIERDNLERERLKGDRMKKRTSKFSAFGL